MNDLERVWIDESFELFPRQFGDEPLRVPVILPTREFFPPPPPATEADVRQLVRKIAGYMGVGPAVMVEFSWDRERITQLRRHLDAPLSRIGGNAVADRGSTVLPAGFSHPHASEEAREIAEKGMILRVQLGSGVHGTSITGQDDRDEMGLFLEPPQFVTGLARVPNGTGGQGPSVRFEQYERHTAWDRPGGVANRSGAGDLDVIIYSARKWARLALAGNPTVLLVLFIPDQEVVFRGEAGAELAGNAQRFVSRLAAARYLGYPRGQKAAMTGQPGPHTNRPELVAVHGYDTKYAMRALRLGLQGIELLSTGRITLPVPEPHRGHLRSIRRGERLLTRLWTPSPTPRFLPIFDEFADPTGRRRGCLWGAEEVGSTIAQGAEIDWDQPGRFPYDRMHAEL